jgi:hypothetical protein
MDILESVYLDTPALPGPPIGLARPQRDSWDPDAEATVAPAAAPAGCLRCCLHGDGARHAGANTGADSHAEPRADALAEPFTFPDRFTQPVAIAIAKRDGQPVADAQPGADTDGDGSALIRLAASDHARQPACG